MRVDTPAPGADHVDPSLIAVEHMGLGQLCIGRDDRGKQLCR